MITFYVKGDFAATERFLSNFRVFKLAVSLGSVDSLIQAPAVMTHSSLAPEIRKELGIDDNMIRISVGIEDIYDLVADL